MCSRSLEYAVGSIFIVLYRMEWTSRSSYGFRARLCQYSRASNPEPLRICAGKQGFEPLRGFMLRHDICLCLMDLQDLCHVYVLTINSTASQTFVYHSRCSHQFLILVIPGYDLHRCRRSMNIFAVVYACVSAKFCHGDEHTYKDDEDQALLDHLCQYFDLLCHRKE